MIQVISVIGAMMILAAYGLSQLGRWSRQEPSYNWMNLIGSVLLFVIAVGERQYGFMLLEGTWAVLSGYTLLKFWPSRTGR